jgi:thiamine biosynthesis lipoprotein
VSPVAERAWVELRLRAIGTYVHVLVTEPAVLAETETVVLAELDALDRACSRFRDDSELALLPSGGGTIEVSRLLADAVAAALAVAEDTDGLVTPTLGGALCAAGYDRTFVALPADGPAAVRLPPRAQLWREIAVQGRELTLPPKVELDLGATAKAWAADRLAQAVAGLGTGVLINLGGDIAVAGAVPDGGWSVAVTDRPGGRVLQTVLLDGGGLATSSTTARTWRRGGQLMHHILDPATGLPAPAEWASVTVCGPTCLAANAASTAAVILGQDAPSWLASGGLPALLLHRDGTVVRLGGWPVES